MAALAPVLDDNPHLTIAAIVTGSTGDVHRFGQRSVPVFRESKQAVRALAHARGYAAWRQEPLTRSAALRGAQAERGRVAIRRPAATGPELVSSGAVSHRPPS